MQVTVSGLERERLKMLGRQCVPGLHSNAQYNVGRRNCWTRYPQDSHESDSLVTARFTIGLLNSCFLPQFHRNSNILGPA